MKEEIKKIVEQGQALAEKRSWLKKGYEDLIEAINAELSNIPDMPEGDIEFELKKWTVEENHYGAPSLGRKITLDMVFEDDAYIVMRSGRQDYDGDWDWSDLKTPSVGNIRLMAEKMQEAFDFYLQEITARNGKYGAAVNTITGLIEKLKS